MEWIFILTVMTFATGMSLGVGSSTLAITSFFAAIADHQIDASERRMLGVIYWVLRMAMVMIGATLLIFTWLFQDVLVGLPYLWVLWFVLVVNAVLMTKHWIPVQIGPALQAGTWYTMGFMLSIEMFALHELTWGLFAAVYVSDFIFAVILVNGFMWLRNKFATN